MLSSVALCAVVLPLLIVTGSAFSPENPVSHSDLAGVDLGLNSPGNGKIAAAWWAAWHPALLPLDEISWKKYTHMTYAFA